MQSPFNDGNVGGGWGPPALNGALLQYYNQVAQQGISSLGGMLGGFIGGGLAGMGGGGAPASAPGVDPGGEMTAGQPTTSSAFSRFMSGGAKGAMGEANPEYKRLQAAGKSADYFMKAGGDEAYAAVGVHPDQWKTLSAGEKAMAVQGYMQEQGLRNQMEQTQALAEERRAKAAEYQMRQEEAQAIPAFAAEIMKSRQAAAGPIQDNPPAGMITQPGGTPTASASSPAQMMQPDAGTTTGTTAPGGTTFSPEEMMGAMSRMGATNPRLGAAMMRVLIPKMMNGDVSGMPTAWKSPEGNPYVFMGHTLMPDRPPMDMSSMMGNAPEGYQAVMTGPNRAQYLKTAKNLPESFHSALDKITSDIADAQGTLDKHDSEFTLAGKAMSPEDIKAMKAAAQRRLDSAQKRGQATIDRYATGGYISPEEKADYYDQLGLSQPKPKTDKPAAKSSAKSTNVNTQAIIEEANKAIAAGADPVKVKARLKEKYGIEVK